jgi:hypothetical protein
MTHLERDRLALALVLPDARVYVAADDLGPLLARYELVGLYGADGEARVGNAYQDGAGMVRFLVFGGPCYAAGVDLVRGLLSMSTVPAVPVAEVEA